MKLSGVQFARPMRPPCRQTRTSSAAAVVLVGREHHPEGRGDRVEGAVGEGQRLGVRHLEDGGQALGLGPGAAAVEQRVDVVGRDDVGAAPGERQGRVAVAGGDVERGRAGRKVERLGEGLADDLQRDADPGIVARGPGGLLALLDGGVVGGGERVGHGSCLRLLACWGEGQLRPMLPRRASSIRSRVRPMSLSMWSLMACSLARERTASSRRRSHSTMAASRACEQPAGLGGSGARAREGDVHLVSPVAGSSRVGAADHARLRDEDGIAPRRPYRPYRTLSIRVSSAAGAYSRSRLMALAFGDFELDESARSLRLGGEPLAVQPLVLSLLGYLVRHAGRVVPKDELLDVLWPGVHVTEASLQRAVSLARTALKAGGMEAALRNIPRLGYRFALDRAALADGGEARDAALTSASSARGDAAKSRDWAERRRGFAEADRRERLGPEDLDLWAYTLECQGRLKAAGPLYARAVEGHIGAVARSSAAARSAVRLSKVEFELGHVDAGRAWIARAEELLGCEGPPEIEAYLLWMKSRYAAFDGDCDLSLALSGARWSWRRRRARRPCGRSPSPTRASTA